MRGIESLAQVLPATEAGISLHIMNKLLESFPANYFTAITIGMGIGLLSCIAGQKWTNEYAYKQCSTKTATHQVITISSFLGDTRYCMHNRTLHYGPAK